MDKKYICIQELQIHAYYYRKEKHFLMIHKRNILPSKEQVFFILFYCIIYVCICMYFFYINNTAKGNTSLMLNKLLHNAG